MGWRVVAALGAASVLTLRGGEEPSRVDFARQIRPILAESCFACHGPDDGRREADLRLDEREGLFADRGGYAAVVPGKSSESELWKKVSAATDGMPPADSGRSLSAEQKELLRRWIDEGAQWSQHWSFDEPRRPAAPEVGEGWARNEIDRFVLAKLRQEGLEPGAEADRIALLRRVSFDLTGLPPTLEEVEAFLSDSSAEAYEKVVERLLASPRYGERQAQEWLDLARYADSNGDGYDGAREMWAWRDWVIRAFNENKPYDQFTVEQLAGDLLPEATREQKLATGFHRNHTIFTKDGANKDEYRHAYVADRVNTTATVWMGLTLACTQCHDHKYDPFSQREYYQLYAYFNNVSEKDVGRGRRNSKPYVHVPDAEQGAKLDELARRIGELETELAADRPEWDADQAAWEREVMERLGGPAQWTPVAPSGLLALGGTKLERLDDGSFLAGGPSPGQESYQLVVEPGKTRITALKLEVLPHESFPRGGSGRSEKGGFLLGEMELYAGSYAQGNEGEKVRFLRGEDDVQLERAVDADKAVDGSDRTGWALVGGEVAEAHEAVFLLEEPLELNEHSFLRFVLQQKQTFRYRNTIGRFRLSTTGDERLLRRRMPVVPSTWRAVGPFPAKTPEEAFATAFAPEAQLEKGIDVESAKYKKVVLQKDEPASGEKKPEVEKEPATPAPMEAAAEPEEPEAFDPDDPKGEKKDDKRLRWEEKKDWRDGGRISLSGKHTAWYLHRKLASEAERDVRVHSTGEEGLKAWLDGELVFERAPAKDPPKRRGGPGGDFGGDSEDDLDADLADDDFFERRARVKPQYDGFDVHLKSGENVLVLKVVSGEKGRQTQLRIQPLGRDVVCHAVERELERKAKSRASGEGTAPPPEIASAPQPLAGGPAETGGDPLEAAAPTARPSPSPAEARRSYAREWFRRFGSSEAGARYAELDRLKLEKSRLEARLPTAMVLDEAVPRETRILLRGAWDKPGDKVESGVPAILPPLPAEAPRNRLGLARWIASPRHPLTARVAVNRIWRQYFGAGLVETAGDFGTRGALPSHPELLDWLARDFADGGWDQKALHRKIVTSATYRQGSRASPGLLERDPANRLLARGPRLRLSAEMIRDNALFLSGLLVEKVGGESVKPYQPAGLWEGIGGFAAPRYEQDHGEKLYRRGIYLFWKRGVLYPSLATFDAPTRATCVSERVETNTPLQALVLLNDPAFVEAARALGARLMTQGGGDRSSRLIYGFRLCTSRTPETAELAVLLRVLDEQVRHYAADEEAAKKLVSVGESKPPEGLDPRELAAWAAIGSLLLNLDATIHRG